MSVIFEPKANSSEEFIAPFGPTMAYKKMSADFVTKMNAHMDKHDKKNNSSKLEDWSPNLVGKVKEELKFDEDIVKLYTDEFADFIGKYMHFTAAKNSFGRHTLNTDEFDYGIQIMSGWFVRQFENEYNPIHVHTACKFSCVGYLKLPDGIEKEFEEDYKDHHPSHGHIQFVHGTPSTNSCTNFVVKPKVGDFYLFPRDLFHCVYPFKTKGERRSFSVNLLFVEMAKGSTHIKEQELVND